MTDVTKIETPPPYMGGIYFEPQKNRHADALTQPYEVNQAPKITPAGVINLDFNRMLGSFSGLLYTKEALLNPITHDTTCQALATMFPDAADLAASMAQTRRQTSREILTEFDIRKHCTDLRENEANKHIKYMIDRANELLSTTKDLELPETNEQPLSPKTSSVLEALWILHRPELFTQVSKEEFAKLIAKTRLSRLMTTPDLELLNKIITCEFSPLSLSTLPDVPTNSDSKPADKYEQDYDQLRALISSTIKQREEMIQNHVFQILATEKTRDPQQ